jgi:hypothetical protein
MAKKNSTKPLDITQTGAQTWRELQTQNNNYQSGEVMSFDEVNDFFNNGKTPSMSSALQAVKGYNTQWEGYNEQSPVLRSSEGKDYLGNSVFDPGIVNDAQWQEWNMGSPNELRAENQPWYSKLVNGIGKAGVLAGTTALETLGLLYGAGHSMLETVGALEDNKKSWLQDLWNNPITEALQNINEASEEYMPNYYTQDEQENPFGNIFTANFLGDKILKNLGFMVGAFYGGIPASKAIGAIGVRSVKAARAASLAERQGMAARIGELTAEYGDDVVGLNKALSAEHLTEAERGKRILEGFDRVREAAKTTRATTQTIGSLGSAVNEGAIEALNNSKDWARQQKLIANDEYQQMLASIEENYGGTELETTLKMQAAEDYQQKLAEIEKGRARMGNADLLLNIPVLMASNMYQLGKLYTRGFDSTRRQMGSLWNGHKLSGDLAKGTLKSDKTWKGALGTALLKSNTEGLEEYLQRAASDGAGEAVNESIERWFDAGTSKEATNNIDDYLVGFGKAIANNLGDPSAWEEYMIGAVSSMVGMPVFGSQTKNAYMKLGPVGFAGGIVGNYQDYMNAKANEEQVAQYLNQRVKDPKFKTLYNNLKKQEDYDRWLQEELDKGDKSKYKDLELEKFYQDLNAAASSGHLEEFKQLVGYNTEYSDEELEDIVKETTKTISPEQQRKQDEDRKAYLEGQLGEVTPHTVLTSDERNLYSELEEINKRLEENDYQEKLEGPFIDVNGQMNVTNPEKMREVLTRNRENLLQGIDDYLKIRNDIDIETDGRLDDNQISLLTQMKGKILSYERRSAEMADDLISNLGSVLANQEDWRDKINSDVEKAQTEYNNAKTHWEKVQKGKHAKEWKEKVEKKYLTAEKKLNRAKAAQNSVGNVIKLLEMLTEEKQTTAGERAAYAKGEGEGIVGRTTARMNTSQTRAINSDEAQTILAHPQNAITLISAINSRTSDLDESTRKKLTQEIVDLSTLANNKVAYNNKVREFMGDPTKINEAYQQAQDRISQQEKDNKSEELSLNIQNASTMSDLDRIMREAYQVSPEIAKAAMDKAKQSADENTKKFIADYEKATKFYGDFSEQVQKLAPELSAGIYETAASEWENALQDGVDVYDKFIEGLNLAADELEKSGVPEAKETADAMKKVLKDLDAAKKSVATHKSPKKSTADSTKKGVEEGGSESVSGEGAGLAGLNKRMAEKRAKKEEKKDETPAEATDTQDSLQKAVEKEVRDNKKKDSIEKLSKALKDRIQKYNEDNPDSPFTMNFEQLLQQITDEEIAADGTNLDASDLKNDGTYLGEDEEGSQRAEDMHNNLRVTFRSDHPTEFRIYDGRNILDYRIPYNPDTEQLKAVQQLLQNLKVYQFVDKNYLGYVMRAMQDKDEPLTVHLLRSTDETINSDSTHPITFMAIKWDSQAENAIRRYGFNGNKDTNLSDEVKPVTINGEQYHIIGVMTLNNEVAQEVSDAFASLQGALNQELTPQIEQAKENGEQFVVSEKTTVVDSIYTGRLEKKNSEDDGGAKVSLYDFMTTNQEDAKNSATKDRRVSTEWDSGMEFYFGTVVNGMLNTVEDDKITDIMELPNDRWMDKNNGAIVLFVPKADGRLYPIRCTRRTVREWLDSNDVDGGRNSEELLQAVMKGEVKNAYLSSILKYLKIVFDEDSTLADKMTAKTMLQKYFIFGKESPIHFNDREVALTFDENEYDITSDTFEEFVQAFFDALGKENIMFSLPSPTIENVSGRDVIKSGIFEIGLRGFYNFNANFTIQPIDGTGNPVNVNSDTGEGEHFAGGRNIRSTQVEFDLGDGMKSYTIDGDGVVTLDGKPVSADTQNIITLARQAQQGTLPQFQTEQLDARFSSNPEVKRFVANGIQEFSDVYIIHAEEDWVYDGRKGDHDARLYKLSSDEGTKLKKEFNQAINDFTQKPENLQEIMKLKKAGKSAFEEQDNQGQHLSKEDAEASLRNVGKQMKDAMTESADIDLLSSLIELGEEAIHQAKEAGVTSSLISNINGIYKGLKTKRDHLLKVSLTAPSGSAPQSGKMFAGKTIGQLNPKNGGLEGLIAVNGSNLSVKKVFEALQGAEDAGIPINYDKVNTDLQALLGADKAQIKQLRDVLIHEIQGCNK